MPEQAQPTLTPEAVRRMAHDFIGVPLDEAELEALLPLLAMVLADVAAAQAFDRRGLEPQIRFVLEEWPS
jgi:hypothetical protein